MEGLEQAQTALRLQAIAAQAKPLSGGGQPPPQLSPFPALSPAALSAILTPSGSGFRVDFGAALQVVPSTTYTPPLATQSKGARE